MSITISVASGVTHTYMVRSLSMHPRTFHCTLQCALCIELVFFSNPARNASSQKKSDCLAVCVVILL